MAERVKLRCASKVGIDLAVSELEISDINTTDAMQHNRDDPKTVDCMRQSLVISSELDAELQQLRRKVEQLEIDHTVISLTLDECKEHCEHLYLLCGKYESNAIALQYAVNCTDRAIEAYDVMLALLESKLALIKDKSVASEESRRAVESVARHLLDRLESEKNMCENSLGPWQNTFSIPENSGMPWTMEDDSRLRNHVSKLKGFRATVQNTIVSLESPYSDIYEKSRTALKTGNEYTKIDRTHLDLEMAVLMQELLNVREDNIQLKRKVLETEKCRVHAIDKMRILQEAIKPLQLQLANDSNILFHHNSSENRMSYSEADHAALTEQQLVEALTRESELKSRIQTLIATVSASQKVSDERYEQLHNTILELQKSNLNLSQLLEQNKRKYQARIRKLEQKVIEMTVGYERQSNRDSGSTVNADFSQRQKCKMAITKSLPQDIVPETTL